MNICFLVMPTDTILYRTEIVKTTEKVLGPSNIVVGNGRLGVKMVENSLNNS